MSDKYVLQGTEAVPESDLLQWAQWFETADRRVALTEVAEGVEVSTVFLGLNHAFLGGPPLLYETMIFWPNSPYDNDLERCATWGEAEQMHERMVTKVRSILEATSSTPPPL